MRIDWRCLVPLPLVALLTIWLGVQSYRAEWFASQATLQMRDGDAVASYRLALMATNAQPRNALLRMQVMLALGRVMDLPARIIVYHEAADRAYAMARSASPYHPAVLLLRLEYLINTGRNPDEATALMAVLSDRFSHHPAVREIVRPGRG